MLSDAGGDSSRRRRDIFLLCCFFSFLAGSFYFRFGLSASFGISYPSLPVSVPTMDDATSNPSYQRRGLPGSDFFSGEPRRILSANVDHGYYVRELTICFSVLGYEGKSFLLHRRSMKASSIAFLADQRLRRTSTTFESVVKMALEDLSLLHQISFVPAPSTVATRWNRRSMFMHSPMLPPAKPHSRPFKNLPPLSHQGICFIVLVKKKLGFSLLGLVQFGPLKSFSWPIAKYGSPSPTFNRPRFVSCINLTNPWTLLNRHKVMSCRGLYSSLVSSSIQGFFNLPPVGRNHVQPSATIGIRIKRYQDGFITHLRGSDTKNESHKDRHPSSNNQKALPHSALPLARLSYILWSIANLYKPNLKFQDHEGPSFLTSSIMERYIQSISSIKERSLPPFSSFEERFLSPLSLSMRGELSTASRPDLFKALTVLFSKILVHTGPLETTGIIRLRTEVMVILSKSLGIMTISRLVDEFELKIVSFTDVFGLEFFNSSPNKQSNFIKFVSLSLDYGCSNVLAIWLAFRACPIKHIYHVTV